MMMSIVKRLQCEFFERSLKDRWSRKLGKDSSICQDGKNSKKTRGDSYSVDAIRFCQKQMQRISFCGIAFWSCGLAFADEIDHPKRIAQYTIEIKRDLSNIKNAKEVTFVFDLPFSEHLIRSSEEMLRKTGCSYVGRDPQKIKELVAIIEDQLVESNGIINDDDLDISGSGISQGIFFKMENGSEDKLILSEDLPGKKFVTGVLNKKTILFHSSIFFGLYKWAKNSDQFIADINAGMSVGSVYSHAFGNLRACDSFMRSH